MAKLWAMQRGAHSSSPEWARDGDSAAAELSARERQEGGNGRVHALGGVAVEVMHISIAVNGGELVNGDGLHSETAMLVWQSYFDDD